MKDTEPRNLAKFGKFSELKALWDRGEHFDLGMVFERAITDFRTVKRKPEHLQILQFCLAQGVELTPKRIRLAAQFDNGAILEGVGASRFPDAPEVAASLGDRQFLQSSSMTLSDYHDSNGFNLLHACATSGLGRSDTNRATKLSETCHYLISNGVSTTKVVERGIAFTPAYGCAAFGGNVAIMNALIEQGNIDISNMHLEVEFALEPHQRSGDPFYDIAATILQHGFDLNSIRPNQGRTLLHGCATRGTLKAVNWLLEQGADPNALDLKGRTPLHVAAERNTHPNVIKRLLQAEAKIDTPDPSGRSVLEIAKDNGRTKVVEFLTA